MINGSHLDSFQLERFRIDDNLYFSIRQFYRVLRVGHFIIYLFIHFFLKWFLGRFSHCFVYLLIYFFFGTFFLCKSFGIVFDGFLRRLRVVFNSSLTISNNSSTVLEQFRCNFGLFVTLQVDIFVLTFHVRNLES